MNDEKNISLLAGAAETSAPSLYRVQLHNDDFTPMEFVVRALEMFFYMNRIEAVHTMFEAHQNGRAFCGLYTKDIAETKVALIVDYATKNDHPLICSKEAV